MDNRKLRNRFPIFVFILIALFGCELEQDAIQKNSYQEKVKIRRSTFDALLKERNFVNAFSKLSQGQNKGLQSKTVMEAEYGFTVMPNLAKVIESAGSTSYTFKITREINSIDYFENLVVNVDSLGQSSAYILKYTPSEPLTPAAHNSFNFTGRVKITPITYNTDEIGKTTICVTAQILMCDQAWSSTNTGVHVATNDCQDQNHLFYAPVTTCYSVNGDIGGGDFGDDPGVIVPIGGGGDGSPPTEGGLTPPNNCQRCPIIITAPVEDPDPATQTPPTPCNHLKNLTASPAVKSSFKTLDSRKTQDGEWGFGFQTQNSTSNSIQPPNVIEASYNNPNKLNMEKAIGGNYIGASHTHPHISYGYYPMFSYDDLQYLMQVGLKHDNNGKPKDWTKYVLTLTTYDGIFAIKIKDPVKFFAAMGQNGKKINTRIQDDYRSLSTGTSMDTFKKTFLNILADFDLGVGLYEGSIDLNATDLASTNFNWGELSQSKGKIVNTPCP
ncbi:hypothetical protein E6C50_08815 [Flavobacterium supellecticarium]|uniref:Uncharacterized protein n=1 Tax=Flavobacterium supellecticarium TaxID=2565924 RepID=A0A4S4A0K7_9FLAO|nr:hypothetical protein [Flavobacterium supellecticarium]THF51844.1 hypothetical protein E6C50_08815 [Flavobacterium supellecticarium]